jgi:hypothetical protein
MIFFPFAYLTPLRTSWEDYGMAGGVLIGGSIMLLIFFSYFLLFLWRKYPSKKINPFSLFKPQNKLLKSLCWAFVFAVTGFISWFFLSFETPLQQWQWLMIGGVFFYSYMILNSFAEIICVEIRGSLNRYTENFFLYLFGLPIATIFALLIVLSYAVQGPTII